ncbi:MAG: RDD family protein, partial [Actinomycetota bacterium]
MAFCQQCGNQVADDASFCTSCGAQRTPAAQPAQGWQQQTVTPRWPGMAYNLPPSGAGSLADPGARLVARIIDALVVAVGFVVLLIVMAIVGAGLASAGASGAGGGFFISGLLGLVVVAFGYEIVFIATRGQTPGKMAMSVKVVRTVDGQIPDWGGSFLRWVVPLAMSILP